VSAHRAYLGLGGNVGNAAAQVTRALRALEALGTVVRKSALYRTRPWGIRDQPPFVNAVALLETTLSPAGLLAAVKSLEKRLGRTLGERWGPRSIDIDVLTYDELAIDDGDLQLPHPRLRERAFVLVPLAEIDPGFEPLRDALPAEELAGVDRIGAG
jgi:2-amino-4-hydroxy-6-hydroxymethyldihydropteridine diphosphokinase